MLKKNTSADVKSWGGTKKGNLKLFLVDINEMQKKLFFEYETVAFLTNDRACFNKQSLKLQSQPNNVFAIRKLSFQ